MMIRWLPKAAMDSLRYRLYRVPGTDSWSCISSHKVYSCHIKAKERLIIPQTLKTVSLINRCCCKYTYNIENLYICDEHGPKLTNQGLWKQEEEQGPGIRFPSLRCGMQRSTHSRFATRWSEAMNPEDRAWWDALLLPGKLWPSS